MIKITNYPTSIKIGDTSYPNGSLSIKNIGDTIFLLNDDFKEVLSSLWTMFVDSNGDSYVSIDAVITDLEISFGEVAPIVVGHVIVDSMPDVVISELPSVVVSEMPTINTVATEDFYLNVARQILPNYKVITIFGRNPDVDASDVETIWNGNGLYTGHNAVVQQKIQLLSTSSLDGNGLTGARTVFIEGLSGTYEEQSEIITLNGTTPVDSVLSYLRCSYAEVETAGSIGSNAGTITARQKITTANVYFNIPIGYNHTAVCVYTIPLGYTGFLRRLTGSLIASNSNSEIRFSRRKIGGVWTIEDVGIATEALNAQKDYPLYHDEPIPEKTDIRIDATSTQNNAIITGDIHLMLVKN